ncbi:peptide ABC transporter substrate-binding protein [Natronincola ferrireducens]|uniref:Peptide/nickel transport system substrate-binding protein n=1 Tax=Natronincola ferrireducens TaxID=393762 RepID=A0A1G9A8T5_9FIRM|nr:peptide ABC transporter substrate-binding protein [Natronincola ferrireducens]SDK23772.1 peptide/nickel transport system substrate-binding protein [Natronincola ferrireducens]
MKKRRQLVVIFLIILSIFLTACSTEEVDPIEEEETKENIENYEPADGGTLNLSVTRFNTFNPLFNNNYSLFQLHHLIYEGLVTFDPNMDIKPKLAIDWTIAQDGQSIQFTLRDGVTWHDGKPLTAEDVIFTVNLIKGNIRNAKGTSIFRTSLQQISDIREIKDGVINVTFSSPFSNALEVMTFPILPKHLFEGNNIEKLNSPNFPMVGTGPYQLDQYETMRKIKLTKNKNYWGQVPYIQDIEVTIVPDLEAQLSVFENGDIDVAQPISIDWAKYMENRNVKVYEYVSNNYEFLGLNFRNSILRDKNIRKAIAYGIDRHKLINNIYLGHGTVVDGPIYPLSLLYDEGSLQYGYNRDQAEALLQESGYELDRENNTRSNGNGDTLNFTLISNKNNVLREKTVFFIEDELEAIGIKIDVELLDWEELNERIARGNFDIVLGGWELAYLPDLSFAFHSRQLGGSNFIAYNNEEMDELLEEAFSAAGLTAKQQAYSQLQIHIAEELPYVSLFFKNGAIVVRDKVKGEFKPSHYNLFYGIEEWYINTK